MHGLRFTGAIVLCCISLLAAPVVAEGGYELSWYTIDGGGATFTTGGDFELSGTIGQADAGPLSGGPFELNGGFWVPLAPACADLIPPQIVHATGQPGQTRPYSGFSDPRMESSNGADFDLGLSDLTVLFTEPVFADAGGPVGPADFRAIETGGGPGPEVIAVDATNNPAIVIRLARPITTQEWTTLIAFVSDACGNAIVTSGDLGPGLVEPDRIDMGFLPGDVDQNGSVSPLDLLRWRQGNAGTWTPPGGVLADFIDTNRDGTVTPLDLLRYRQLLLGSGFSTQSWAGETINATQP